MTELSTLYAVEQGHIDPRSGDTFWTHFDAFPTLATAKKEIKNERGMWRIVKQQVVWQNTELP